MSLITYSSSPHHDNPLMHHLIRALIQAHPEYVAPMLLFILSSNKVLCPKRLDVHMMHQLPTQPIALHVSANTPVQDLALLNPRSIEIFEQLSFYALFEQRSHRMHFQTSVMGIDQPFTFTVSAYFLMQFFCSKKPFDTPIDSSELQLKYMTPMGQHASSLQEVTPSAQLDHPFALFEYLCAQPFDPPSGRLFWDYLAAAFATSTHTPHQEQCLTLLCTHFCRPRIGLLSAHGIKYTLEPQFTSALAFSLEHHGFRFSHFFFDQYPLTLLDPQGYSAFDLALRHHQYQIAPALYHPQTLQWRLEQGHCHAKWCLLHIQPQLADFLIRTHPYTQEHLHMLARTAGEQQYPDIAKLCLDMIQIRKDQQALEHALRLQEDCVSAIDTPVLPHKNTDPHGCVYTAKPMASELSDESGSSGRKRL